MVNLWQPTRWVGFIEWQHCGLLLVLLHWKNDGLTKPCSSGGEKRRFKLRMQLMQLTKHHTSPDKEINNVTVSSITGQYCAVIHLHGKELEKNTEQNTACQYLSVINNACTNPRVWIIMLVEVPKSSSSSKTWYRCIRCAKLLKFLEVNTHDAKSRKTYCNMMLRVEEVFGISGEEFVGNEAFMCIKDSAGPLPHSTV